MGGYPFSEVRPYVTDILKRVIADGKGIEVNTSSHRYGLKDTTPSGEILELYYWLGGRVITLGSDSHKPEHLGSYMGETKELLKTIGFREFCTFERMEPVFHKL
jgi:histidinol-phosphatase (PHP family)